jgi:hypothetical protein
MKGHQMNATAPEPSTSFKNISGLIEGVTFFNEVSGFCVLRLKSTGAPE